jgi:hypothetical protein
LSKHNTDGSFLHVARNSKLRLFSFDDNGAYNLLKVHMLYCIIMLNYTSVLLLTIRSLTLEPKTLHVLYKILLITYLLGK